MNSLFPIKIDIPDNYGLNYYHIFYQKKIVCFLFSNDKIKGISNEHREYFLGEIKKDEKTISIYYVEIDALYNSKIKIDVSGNEFDKRNKNEYLG